MPVPLYPIAAPGHRDLFRRVLSTALLCIFTAPLLAKGPEPPLRIPLEPFGFQPISTQFLVAGSSLFTIHYVDDRHLLLTFTVRRLLSRLPNEPEDDQDRNVDAVLLEVPSGRVLARTSWRLHDHGQYLWALGKGRFLLRIRDTLTTFAPLLNLATEQPFRERPFLHVTGNRRIATLLLSPDPNLLIVETVERTPSEPKPVTPLFGPAPPASPVRSANPSAVQINFYRLYASSDTSDEIKPRAAGIARSATTGEIASTTAGYIAIIDQGHQHWAFDFDSYTGKKNELSAFDSTCRPAPFFVSRSEFIAFGCRGGKARQLLGGFNMRGEETWEQNLFGDYFAPSLVFAPAGGRFAFSRVLLRASTLSDQPVSADDMSSQSIVVYQTASGKQVLHAECSPIERAGQNFSLAPNGLSLAVIHNDAIEIYNLPSLTTKEDKEVKLAEASAPEESDRPIQFSAEQEAAASAETDSSSSPDPSSEATQSAAPSASVSATSPASLGAASSQSESSPPPGVPATPADPADDSSPEQHRKPPTLYNLPGDPPPHNSSDEQPK